MARRFVGGGLAAHCAPMRFAAHGADAAFLEQKLAVRIAGARLILIPDLVVDRRLELVLDPQRLLRRYIARYNFPSERYIASTIGSRLVPSKAG
jgi:hypothetical protein